VFWKYIPPPYDQLKPITMKRYQYPEGAQLTDMKTPDETIQIIGKAAPGMPKEILVDMGMTDIVIVRDSKIGQGGMAGEGISIRHLGHGERTDVGKRVPGNTKGMSIPGNESSESVTAEKPAVSHGEYDDILGNYEDILGIKRPRGGKSTAKSRRKPSERKLSNYDYMTTLKGFKP